MKIFKTIVFFSDDPNPGGNMYLAETIEHKGKLWLVPSWFEAPLEGWKTPARIVCLDTLRHQKTGGLHGADFLVNDPISKAVFDGRAQSAPGHVYVVEERPDIKIPIPRGIH